MLDDAQPTPLKQTPSDRLDATTRAAHEIIEREAVKREAKNVRLRAARLAKQAADLKQPG